MPKQKNTLEGFKDQRVRRKYRPRGQRGRPRTGRRGRAKSQRGVSPRLKDLQLGINGPFKLTNNPNNPGWSRSQPPGAKTRGKVTFWTDLEATYYQRLEPEQIDEVFSQLRGDEPESIDLLPAEFGTRGHGGSQQCRKLFGEFFSFFDYYQEVINELQGYCWFNDSDEVDIMRAAQLIDQHLIIRQSEPGQVDPQPEQLHLLGYEMTPCTENPRYSTDYFANQLLGQTPSRGIDDQLAWLEKHLEVAERQVDACQEALEGKIRSQQKIELRQESYLNSSTNQKRLSEHFAQTVLFLEVMQIAESIERIKAVRRPVPGADPLEVPYILQRAHSNYVEHTTSPHNSLKHHNKSLQGKEFLLSFDKCIKLEDTWMDAPLLALLNQIREELAKRQNSGRGLPVQLGIGFTQVRPRAVNFDLDKQFEFQEPKRPDTRSAKNGTQKRSKVPGRDCAKFPLTNQNTEPDERSTTLDAQTYKQELPKYGNDYSALEFCHHCKQLKRDVVFATCNYRSSKHKMFYPPSAIANGVKIYNAEAHNRNTLDQVILKKLVKDKKRRKTFEDQLEVVCEKSFCSLCLKNFYDQNMEEIRPNLNWICPYCTGACFCTRCRRLEQLTTAKGYLVSLNFKDLLYSPQNAYKVFGAQFNKSTCPLDQRIKAGFEHIVRTCDLTQPKRQSLNSIRQLADLVADNEHSSFFLEAQNSTTNHVHRIMARTKQKKTLEQTRSHPKTSARSSANVTRLRKRLFHEFDDCLEREHQTCSASQYEAFDLLKKINETTLTQPSPAKSDLEEKDDGQVSLDPLQSSVIPDMANKSATSRLYTSRTPSRPQIMIDPPSSKRSPVVLSKTANPSQVKNNTNSNLTQYSINSGAPINLNPHPQQQSRHSTGSTSPSNTSKHFFNNPKIGGGQPLLPEK